MNKIKYSKVSGGDLSHYIHKPKCLEKLRKNEIKQGKGENGKSSGKNQMLKGAKIYFLLK